MSHLFYSRPFRDPYGVWRFKVYCAHTRRPFVVLNTPADVVELTRP